MTNRIRELRTERRLTQLQLSIELGVTQETVSSYESGRYMPSVNILMELSKLFDASMDYIMGISPVRHIQYHDYTAIDEQRDYLLHCYQFLGTNNKARLVSYAQGLLDAQKD